MKNTNNKTFQLEIKVYGELKEKNKFVIGIASEENKVYIAWGNIERYPFHSDIFKELERDLKKTFPEKSRSGGWINIEEINGEVNVIFCKKSEAFGKYDYKILKKYKKEILENLNYKNKKINLKIKTSI